MRILNNNSSSVDRSITVHEVLLSRVENRESIVLYYFFFHYSENTISVNSFDPNERRKTNIVEAKKVESATRRITRNLLFWNGMRDKNQPKLIRYGTVQYQNYERIKNNTVVVVNKSSQ